MVHTAEGARVTTHYHKNSRTLEPLLSEYPSTHLRIEQADPTCESSVQQLYSRIHSEGGLGVVHIPIVNHAIYVHKITPVMDMSLEQWENTLKTNLTSSFLVIREYLRRLDKASTEDKDRANIVLIGSTAGKHGGLNHADYASSKSGEHMYTSMSRRRGLIIGSNDVRTHALSQERNR
jgi:NAD(P)-dependent dehydrogenase (short-subunit alcohol dehydrogenase family)